MAHCTGELVGRFEHGDDPYKNEWLRITNTDVKDYRIAIWDSMHRLFPLCYYVGGDNRCTSDKCACPCHNQMTLPEGLI